MTFLKRFLIEEMVQQQLSMPCAGTHYRCLRCCDRPIGYRRVGNLRQCKESHFIIHFKLIDGLMTAPWSASRPIPSHEGLFVETECFQCFASSLRVIS